MKKLIVFAISLLILPLYCLAAPLTTINTSFDAERCILTVNGYQTGHEASVSLFAKSGDLIGFKTATISSDKYSIDFVITYKTETKIDITVANEFGLGELTKQDISIPTCQLSYRTIYDENDDSLTILDPDGTFDKNDVLSTELEFEFANLDEDQEAQLAAIKKKLGDKKKFIGIMVLRVFGDEGEKEITEMDDGYELFLNIDKETLAKYKNPHMARLLLNEDLEIDKGIKMVFNDSKDGVVTKINNIGAYVLYEDLEEEKEEVVNTGSKTEKANPKTLDNIMKYVTLSVISAGGILLVRKSRKKVK